MTLRLERMALPDVPWRILDTRSDRTIYQTQAWLDFLVETQAAEPVVARVLDGTKPAGWFTGAITRRAGVRVLGSPMRGWTTASMGFNLEPGVSITDALTALPSFAFRDLACLHLEIADRSIADAESVPSGYTLGALDSYTLLLTERTDDDLMADMTRGGRRDVRRALRNGIGVEEVPIYFAFNVFICF